MYSDNFPLLRFHYLKQEKNACKKLLKTKTGKCGTMKKKSTYKNQSMMHALKPENRSYPGPCEISQKLKSLEVQAVDLSFVFNS